MRFFILFSLCLMLTACEKGQSTAVVDVDHVLISSPHAGKAEAEFAKAQEIYQSNLNVIEKKLATYKDKAQAKAWLFEAARQVQGQLDNFHMALLQATGETIRKEIVVLMGTKYDLVLSKNTILANQAALDITAEVQQRYNAATVDWPALPKHVDNPNLPADPEATPPQKAVTPKK